MRLQVTYHVDLLGGGGGGVLQKLNHRVMEIPPTLCLGIHSGITKVDRYACKSSA